MGGKLKVPLDSMANVMGLRLECARVLCESLLVPVLLYSSETVIWRENGRSSVRLCRRTTSEVLLGIRRMGRVPNARIRELCGVVK